MFSELDLQTMNRLPEPIQIHLAEYIRFLTASYRVDGPEMSEQAFEKFLADRRRDASDPAEKVPGEAVLQNIRTRFALQSA